jgi:hypothetical protein
MITPITEAQKLTGYRYYDNFLAKNPHLSFVKWFDGKENALVKDLEIKGIYYVMTWSLKIMSLSDFFEEE